MKIQSQKCLRMARLAILLLVITEVITDNSKSDDMSSFDTLELAPTFLTAMKYGEMRLDIYEHADNKKSTTLPANYKYFYAPIALLDHNSAVASFNNVKKQAQVSFRIEMWNEKIENQVVNYLTEFKKQAIPTHNVQVLPLQRVMLHNPRPSSIFSLPDWLPYRHDKWLNFKMNCLAQKDCDELAADMRSNPQQFNQLKLHLYLTSQKSKTKEMFISIDNVVKGEMVSTLLQKYDRDVNEVFLTAKDTNQLLIETATNIIVEKFEDSDGVSSNSDSQIYNFLDKLLFSSREIIKEQSVKMWDSVFWNEENYRPVKTTKTLNDIHKKLNTESQKKMSEMYQNNKKEGSGLNLGFKIFSAGVNFNTELERHGLTTKEDIDKFYQESKDHVEWDGQKFVAKQLKLNKINLARLRDKQFFKDKTVSVRYSTAFLISSIYFVQNTNLIVTNEWQDIKDELKELIKRLADFTKEMNAFREEALQNLETTRIELQQTKDAVEDLTKKLNARTSEIVDIGIMPTSCSDLQRMGHKLSGFFSVKGSGKIEIVYCNFLSNGKDLQKWIGHAVVKSTPVHFYVQRSTSWNSNGRIPFQSEVVNEGKAMDFLSGIFTAPRNGTYFFSFVGLAEFPASRSRIGLAVYLFLNERLIASGEVNEANSVARQLSPLTLLSTLNLKKGDTVWMKMDGAHVAGAFLYDDGDHRTHFTGFLLE